MDSPSPGTDGSSWSKLPSDLLHMVFERFGFADFQRAKSVCPSWHSASRQSAPNNQIPWLILFAEKGNDYCLLLNPEEKTKVYRIQDLGAEFANSHFLAMYGNWFFMQDPQHNLYIMNIFTRERIGLPSVESQFGEIKIERTTDNMFLIKVNNTSDGFLTKYIDINFPKLWIDEKTKDYVVMWVIWYQRYRYIVYSRKGDNCWKDANYDSVNMTRIVDMVYKDHKLYLYSSSRDVKVLEFSGDILRQIFETQVNYNKKWRMPRRVYPELGHVWNIKKTHLVVRVTGETLRVKSIIKTNSDVWSFRIYKMDSTNSKWEKITYLGDETILLDQGITVLTNAINGVNRNSIYFSGKHNSPHHYYNYGVWSKKDIFIFNLDTHKVERPHPSICLSIQSSDARWFVPSFKRND